MCFYIRNYECTGKNKHNHKPEKSTSFSKHAWRRDCTFGRTVYFKASGVKSTRDSCRWSPTEVQQFQVGSYKIGQLEYMFMAKTFTELNLNGECVFQLMKQLRLNTIETQTRAPQQVLKSPSADAFTEFKTPLNWTNVALFVFPTLAIPSNLRWRTCPALYTAATVILYSNGQDWSQMQTLQGVSKNSWLNSSLNTSTCWSILQNTWYCTK